MKHLKESLEDKVGGWHWNTVLASTFCACVRQRIYLSGQPYRTEFA